MTEFYYFSRYIKSFRFLVRQNRVWSIWYLLSFSSWKYQKHPFPLEDSSPKSVYSPNYPPRCVLGQQNPAFFIVFFFSFFPSRTQQTKATALYKHNRKETNMGRIKTERERERERGKSIVFSVLVMAKKTWSLKKVMMKKDQLWPWKISGIKWKRGLDFQLNIIDNLVFKVLYVAEAVVLVSTLCFFYLCCGCHIWILDYRLPGFSTHLFFLCSGSVFTFLSLGFPDLRVCIGI